MSCCHCNIRSVKKKKKIVNEQPGIYTHYGDLQLESPQAVVEASLNVD